jgi:hypothetical protein
LNLRAVGCSLQNPSSHNYCQQQQQQQRMLPLPSILFQHCCAGHTADSPHWTCLHGQLLSWQRRNPPACHLQLVLLLLQLLLAKVQGLLYP